MAGATIFANAPGYQARPVPGAAASPSPGGGSHMSFIVWVILIGIVLPGIILGGLKVGGFKFVFKGR